jgi:hypothetical protein
VLERRPGAELKPPILLLPDGDTLSALRERVRVEKRSHEQRYDVIQIGALRWAAADRIATERARCVARRLPAEPRAETVAAKRMSTKQRVRIGQPFETDGAHQLTFDQRARIAHARRVLQSRLRVSAPLGPH